MKDKNQDVRWKQRFQNFQKAYELLENTLQIDKPSDAERAGLIQFFEMAFELAWKLMKDYLEEQGFTVNSPKDAIKQAFQSNILADGHTWMDALEDRNLTAHTYEEATAIRVEQKIKRDYFPLLKNLHDYFCEKL
jgi:nucleotidyltransferase substrate binding protein (TIGR01987 family)